jgi:hypothetical protein
MRKVPSHYDNLKVSRDAPAEVIRAAYRSLSQKYHPDRNAGDAEAARIMVLLNASYEILSDPEKRRAHDRWLLLTEAAGGVGTEPSGGQAKPAPAPGTNAKPPPEGSFEGEAGLSPQAAACYRHLGRFGAWYFLLGFLIWIGVNDWSPKTKSGTGPQTSTFEQALAPAPNYVRPATAPNGEPWPAASGYISGFPRLRTNGLSSVTIDNTQNETDVMVKLVGMYGEEPIPVRTIYIAAHDSFTAERVNKGTYDIRYRDLESGALSRSEPFALLEIPMPSGTQYSTITMTLYKVQNGNMQTYGLSEDQF